MFLLCLDYYFYYYSFYHVRFLCLWMQSRMIVKIKKPKCTREYIFGFIYRYSKFCPHNKSEIIKLMGGNGIGETPNYT